MLSTVIQGYHLDMDWIAGGVFVVMFGLFVWASRTANSIVKKNVQPIIDDVLGKRPDPNQADSPSKPGRTNGANLR
jgi:hypothetical protein